MTYFLFGKKKRRWKTIYFVHVLKKKMHEKETYNNYNRTESNPTYVGLEEK